MRFLFALMALLLDFGLAHAATALVCGTPPAIMQTFSTATPNELHLPSGDIVAGAKAGWAAQGCSLVAAKPFMPPDGQNIAGSATYSVDAKGDVSTSYPTVPTPITSMDFVSKSTPDLNASYSIDPTIQQRVQAISLYILMNGKFPAGLSALTWPDANGTPHLFPTTAAWQSFVTAMADFVTALALDQKLTQPVTIP